MLGEYILAECMLQNDSGPAVNQKDLLDLVDQSVQQDDLDEGLAGAQRLQSPLQAPQRKAVLQELVEALDHALQSGGDRLADRRSHHWEQRVHQNLAVFPYGGADGVFGDRPQGQRELFISRCT